MCEIVMFFFFLGVWGLLFLFDTSVNFATGRKVCNSCILLSAYSPAKKVNICFICFVYWDVTVKQYNIRLEPVQVGELDSLGGCRSVHIREAVTKYLHGNIQQDNDYNQELVDVLKDQVADLKQDKDILQKRVDYYSLGWFQRLLLPKH